MIPETTTPAALTSDQMREVDRIMVEDLGIDLVQMVENAGRGLAWLARERFDPKRAIVLAGPGGNGGGGLVAARHLSNREVETMIVLSDDKLDDMPQQQAQALREMGAAFTTDPADADLVIDAMIGYSLHGDPEGRVAELIEWSNHQPAPVLSLDLPSGLDATTGIIGDPCIRATATMTLALPKAGLALAPTVVGELYLADVSVPRSVLQRIGIEIEDPFHEGPVVGLV